jgi:hypothetical protein
MVSKCIQIKYVMSYEYKKLSLISLSVFLADANLGKNVFHCAYRKRSYSDSLRDGANLQTASKPYSVTYVTYYKETRYF